MSSNLDWFSVQSFSGLWEFIKLSSAPGVMLCLEIWYYRILMLMTGYLKNATIAVDALSICTNINGLEMMIHLAFFAGTRHKQLFCLILRVIGVFFCVLIMIFLPMLSYVFTSSTDVLLAVNQMSYLLGATILLNSVQLVLSGVAVGSGWQAKVAYINLGCYYYIIGIPLGAVMGWLFNLGVTGVWGGMILGGTVVQTLMLGVITMRTDWEKQAEIASKRVTKS